jgi:hypothetical protein
MAFDISCSQLLIRSHIVSITSRRSFVDTKTVKPRSKDILLRNQRSTVYSLWTNSFDSKNGRGKSDPCMSLDRVLIIHRIPVETSFLTKRIFVEISQNFRHMPEYGGQKDKLMTNY